MLGRLNFPSEWAENGERRRADLSERVNFSLPEVEHPAIADPMFAVDPPSVSYIHIDYCNGRWGPISPSCPARRIAP
jgi:hypothetical protein